MRDTTPEARSIVAQAIRARSKAQRLADCIAFSEEMRDLAIAGLARRYPQDDRAALVARLVRSAERLAMHRNAES